MDRESSLTGITFMHSMVINFSTLGNLHIFLTAFVSPEKPGESLGNILNWIRERRRRCKDAGFGTHCTGRSIRIDISLPMTF